MRQLLPDGYRKNHSLHVYCHAMLLYSLKRAAVVVALDRFMKDRIQAKGIPAEKVVVVPPWSHDDIVRFDRDGQGRVPCQL